MNKKEVAHILEEIGTILELKGENPFGIGIARKGGFSKEDILNTLTANQLQEIHNPIPYKLKYRHR